MSMCQVCNGLREVSLFCANCGNPMMESGRIMDFYDDYSPYMEIDLMKLEDGYPDTNSAGKCPHLFCCQTCKNDEVILITE
ncbi:MAG: hypothetical protein K6T88_10535 [Bacillus sp. (in: Bacteria)]|nr:hypothetical protein [Bacillus sp. (in: firmicutes)]